MKLFCLCLLSVSALAAQSIPTEPILDIVGFRASASGPRNDVRDLASPVNTIAGDGSGEKISVAIDLVELQRDVFKLGESLIYEVVLENTGRRPITLPWSPDTERFRDVSHKRAFLLLEIRDAGGKRVLARLEPQVLFGSKAVADSLLTLAPGRRARVRVPGWLRVTEREMSLMSEHPAGQVQLSATLLMQHQEMRSAGTLITVRP
jgi:hypothetical protein